jgi:hypothetical protein
MVAQPGPAGPGRSLTPEEDAIDDADDLPDEVDDTLPGDLWFHHRDRNARQPGDRFSISSRPARRRSVRSITKN